MEYRPEMITGISKTGYLSASEYTPSKVQKTDGVTGDKEDVPEKQQNLRVPAGYDLSKGELILHNYEDRLSKILQPYECRVYRFQ